MAKKSTRSTSKAQPLIVVKNVEKSSRWYQAVLNCKSGHGGDEYEMLMSGKELILQLHAWDVHEHGHFGSSKVEARGNGVLLWFEVSDMDGAIKRIKKHKARVLVKSHFNPRAGHREVWLQDPDGYVVVLAGE